MKTINELAKEYVAYNNTKPNDNLDCEKHYSLGLEKGFIDGYNHALSSQWHNIRDNPNDLPTTENGINLDIIAIVWSKHYKKWIYKKVTYQKAHKTFYDESICKPLAWMYIPKFNI